MTSLQKRRIWFAHLFQMVILFFVLFPVYVEANHPLRFPSDSKPLLCVRSASAIVVGEASEPLSATLSFIKLPGTLEKIWLCAERVYASELLTNTALHISNRVYNIFYILITIHAP